MSRNKSKCQTGFFLDEISILSNVLETRYIPERESERERGRVMRKRRKHKEERKRKK